MAHPALSLPGTVLGPLDVMVVALEPAGIALMKVLPAAQPCRRLPEPADRARRAVSRHRGAGRSGPRLMRCQAPLRRRPCALSPAAGDVRRTRVLEHDDRTGADGDVATGFDSEGCRVIWCRRVMSVDLDVPLRLRPGGGRAEAEGFPPGVHQDEEVVVDQE